MANIQSLIDKQDNFEIIRDEISAILAIEVAEQKVLATAAGEDPNEWNFDVFTERSNPWAVFYDSDGAVEKDTPLVNVCFDSLSQTGTESNQTERTKVTGKFFIDALAAKTDKPDAVGSDYEFGDELSAKDVQRIARLVRNILMAGIYRYIFTSTENGVSVSVPGIVTKRYFESIQVFKPDINDRPLTHVIGARLTLTVEFVEFSPQYEGTDLETLFSQCTRGEDGAVYFEAETDTTA